MKLRKKIRIRGKNRKRETKEEQEFQPCHSQVESHSSFTTDKSVMNLSIHAVKTSQTSNQKSHQDHSLGTLANQRLACDWGDSFPVF